METIKCKAWDLMGEYYMNWANDDYLVRLVGGRAFYTDVRNTKTDNICLQRLNGDLSVTTRYVKWNAKVELVYFPKAR